MYNSCNINNRMTYHKVVLDILPKGYESYLTKYFNSFSKEDRSKVKYFVSDMWKPYSNISSVWFKNATQIVDKYHWIRQVIWAFEAVRKQEQKKFSKSHRRYFKKSRQLLIKRFMDALGFGRSYTPHSCRRTFSTRMSAAGARQEDIIALMGHTDYKVDIEHYIVQEVDTLYSAINKMA